MKLLAFECENEETLIEVLWCLYQKTSLRLDYERMDSVRQAKTSWAFKKGDCTDYSLVFCSMARTINIPCRIASSQERNHDLVEVKLYTERGILWTPLEITEPVDGHYISQDITPKSHYLEKKTIYLNDLGKVD